MTLRRFLPVALTLLAVNAIHAQLAPPEPERATDYQNWFGSLAPSSGFLVSSLQDPEAYNFSSAQGVWHPWTTTDEIGLALEPLLTYSHPLNCEIIFLGCTGSGWSSFGYSVSAVDHTLSSALSTLQFGDYIEFESPVFSTLNVFVERSDGTRYEAFSTDSASIAVLGTLVSIYAPKESTREISFYPYTIFAFSPDLSAADPEIFVFAITAGFDSIAVPVPEPSTYGALGAAALLGVAALRRRRRKAWPSA